MIVNHNWKNYFSFTLKLEHIIQKDARYTNHITTNSGTCFWMTLHVGHKILWSLHLFQYFTHWLYGGNSLLHQGDNNKMAAGVTSMWFNKCILLNSCPFQSCLKEYLNESYEWSVPNAKGWSYPPSWNCCYGQLIKSALILSTSRSLM